MVRDVLNSRLGDLDLDGKVNFTDFLSFSANFGKTDATFEQGDQDGDGEVNFADFLEMSQNFGYQRD